MPAKSSIQQKDKADSGLIISIQLMFNVRSKQREQEKRQKKNNHDTNDSQITADATTNTTGKQSVF